MDVEETKYFGSCKCCLRDGCFTCMWVEYNEDGAVQNYGEILNECFALGWERPDNHHLDHICGRCILQAKNAYSFRKQILTSQDLLNNVKNEGNVIETMHEDAETFIVKVDNLDEDNLVYDKVDPNDPDDLQADDTADSEDREYDPVEYIEEFEEVEYLEFDESKQDKGTDGGEEVIIPERITDQPQRRRPKKKRAERRRYLNYSLEDLKKCMEVARSGEMSIRQAALRCNVPRQTVQGKLLMEKRGEVPKLPKVRHRMFVEEIKTILTYTDATPYKTRTTHYHCAYCSTTGPMFEDADELRTHTRTQHAGERTKSVEQFLKPHWLNEVLKVDIENLHCTVCCTALISWNDMFKHLKEQHNLDFHEAYSRVIPYKLKRKHRCALCKEAFPNYHMLDGHMNAHYNNYTCSECGDTFLSYNRLNKHVKTRKTCKFLCGECGKTFCLEKYKKKHIAMVHKQEQNINVCVLRDHSQNET